MTHQFEPIGDENLFEDFCKDLLNLINSTNSFQLYKTKGAIQHGVDLYSQEKKIVAQCKKKKILRSDKGLENELISDIDKSLTLLKEFPHEFDTFIFLTTTKKYGSLHDYFLKLSSSNLFKVVFWSWEDIEPYILTHEELRKKYYPHLWTKDQYPKVITYIPKIDPNEIIGRIDELTILENIIETSQKAIIINGIGGIGKSTLAKLYINKNFELFNHIIWIDAQNYSINKIVDGVESSDIAESFSNNIVLLKNIHLNLEFNMRIEEKILLILNKIQNIPGKNLLIIDNVNNEIVNYNNELPGKPNWNILLTSREKIANYSCINLDVLDNESAKNLFYKHYKLEKNHNVYSILEYVGNHTLTIELLAKTANKRNLSIENLILALEKEGLNIHKAAKISVNHNIEKRLINPFEYLTTIFSVSNLSEKQQQILRFFSILPSKLISYDDLKLIFQVPENDNDFFDDISELVSQGWINIVVSSYQMHQVIQEVLRSKLNPGYDNCKILIESINKIMNIDFVENPINIAQYIIIAESIAQHINDDIVEMGKFYSLLGYREEDFFNMQKSLYYQHKAQALFEVNDVKYAEDLSACYNNLQSVYKELGYVDKALSYQLSAIKIQENTLHPLHPDIGTSYNNLSLIYQIVGKYNDALNYLQKAIIIAEYNLSEDHPHLAAVYNNYSLLLNAIGQKSIALDYQEKSFNIRNKVLPENHPAIAESYGNLSVMYQESGRKKEAREYLYESIKIRKEIYSERHFSLGASYNNLASMYLDENDLINAEKTQKLAISIEEEAFGEKHFTLATTYSTMAVIQMELGNKNNAKICIKKSISIAKYNFPEGHESLNMYYTFLKNIDNIL